MNENIVIALIGTVPGTLTAIVALTSRPRPAADGVPAGHPNLLRRTEESPSRLRFAVVTVGAAVVTAGVALALLNIAKVAGSDTVSREVSVLGTQTWTNTGIDVDEGDEIVITATGEVMHSTTHNQKSGPDGDPGKRYPSNVLRTVDHGALLGMITSEGQPFLVGAGRTFRAPATGRLFLGVNDVGTDNNAGAFTVAVKVKPDET